MILHLEHHFINLQSQLDILRNIIIEINKVRVTIRRISVVGVLVSDLLDDLLDVLHAGGGLVSHHHRLPLLLLTPQARLNTSQSI